MPVAVCILLLTSDDASHVTGTLLFVGSGYRDVTDGLRLPGSRRARRKTQWRPYPDALLLVATYRNRRETRGQAVAARAKHSTTTSNKLA
jgi:hypothetical protein